MLGWSRLCFFNQLSFLVSNFAVISRNLSIRSAGGLVTAVAPVVINGKGVWVGWPGMHMENPDEPIPESDPNDRTPTAGLSSRKVSLRRFRSIRSSESTISRVIRFERSRATQRIVGRTVSSQCHRFHRFHRFRQFHHLLVTETGFSSVAARYNRFALGESLPIVAYIRNRALSLRIVALSK